MVTSGLLDGFTADVPARPLANTPCPTGIDTPAWDRVGFTTGRCEGLCAGAVKEDRGGCDCDCGGATYAGAGAGGALRLGGAKEEDCWGGGGGGMEELKLE